MRRDDHGLAESIERALAATSAHVAPVRPGIWQAALSNGVSADVTARFADGEWLEVAAAAPKTVQTARDWWSVIQWNSALTGAPRLVRGRDGVLTLAAEILLRSEPGEAAGRAASPLAARVAALCGDMLHACAALLDAVTKPEAARAVPVCQGEHSAGPSATDDLATLCAQGGWTASRAACGHLTVPLNGAGDAAAHLQLLAGGQIRAVAPLTASVVSPLCGAAIGLLLLEATASVRTVKGVIFRDDQCDRAGLSAAGETGPATASAVVRALEALSVASHLVGREVRALEIEAVAADYLAVRAARQHYEPKEPSCPHQLQPLS